jgi:ankyrin repeat protein
MERPTVIRLKRKRNELPQDAIVVESQPPAAKRRNVASADVADVADALAAVVKTDASGSNTAATKATPDTSAPSAAAAKPPALVFKRVVSIPAKGAVQSQAQKILENVDKLFGRDGGKGGSRKSKGPASEAQKDPYGLQAIKALAAKKGQQRGAASRQAATQQKRKALGAGEDDEEDNNGLAGRIAAGGFASEAGLLPSSNDLDEHLKAMFRVYDVQAQQKAQQRAQELGAIDSKAAAESADKEKQAGGGSGSSSAALVRRRVGLRNISRAGVAYRASFTPLTDLFPRRIFKPAERSMDEAIWGAFQKNNFSAVFQALSMGADVNFQRSKSDLTTALMAAAYHGQARIAATLIRSDALVRIKNSHGTTAVDIAIERGHEDLARFLHDALVEELEEIERYNSGETSIVAVMPPQKPPKIPGIKHQPPQMPAAADEEDDDDEELYDYFVVQPQEGETGEKAGTDDGGKKEEITTTTTTSSTTNKMAVPSSLFNELSGYVLGRERKGGSSKANKTVAGAKRVTRNLIGKPSAASAAATAPFTPTAGNAPSSLQEQRSDGRGDLPEDWAVDSSDEEEAESQFAPGKKLASSTYVHGHTGGDDGDNGDEDEEDGYRDEGADDEVPSDSEWLVNEGGEGGLIAEDDDSDRDSEDSNAEGHYTHEYPDQDGVVDGGNEDDDDDEEGDSDDAGEEGADDAQKGIFGSRKIASMVARSSRRKTAKKGSNSNNNKNPLGNPFMNDYYDENDDDDEDDESSDEGDEEADDALRNFGTGKGSSRRKNSSYSKKKTIDNDVDDEIDGIAGGLFLPKGNSLVTGVGVHTAAGNDDDNSLRAAGGIDIERFYASSTSNPVSTASAEHARRFAAATASMELDATAAPTTSASSAGAGSSGSSNRKSVRFGTDVIPAPDPASVPGAPSGKSLFASGPATGPGLRGDAAIYRGEANPQPDRASTFALVAPKAALEPAASGGAGGAGGNSSKKVKLARLLELLPVGHPARDPDADPEEVEEYLAFLQEQEQKGKGKK